MKTTENSSNDFNDEVKRLFSGMLLGSLLLLASTFQLVAQCVNVGPVMNPICQGETTPALGGSFDPDATGATWSTVSGGTFTNNDGLTPNITTWTPPAEYYGTATLILTASGGTCDGVSDSKQIVVNESPTTATIATTPLDYCGTLISGSLGGNTPTVGTGSWSIETGGTGTFSDGTSGSSTFTADAYGTYELRWTISNGPCTTSSAEVAVNFYESPTTATIATTPLDYCGTLISGSLGGNAPTVGTGSWSIETGGTGTFSDGTSGSSTFTAAAYGTYILRWTISNGTCTSNIADVTVNYHVNFTLSLTAGWNWFSVNTMHTDMSLNNILSTGFTDGDYIKNQTSFAFYSSADGWVGSFNMIDPADLYIIRVENATGINFCGTPVNVNSTIVPVVTGWNWIGYLPTFSLPLRDALGTLSVVTGDYIKDQTGYADYFGTSWFGSLLNMSPGKGYMLRLTNPGELLYPDSPAKSSQETDIMPVDYSFSPHKYEFNGSVTADVMLDDIPARSEKDFLYAYVDEEIRGVAHGIFIDSQDSYIFPLMIHSNKPEGEVIHFRYYNSEQNRFYTCMENVPFKADMIISNPVKSFRINIVSDKKSAMDDTSSDLQLTAYPNPFKNILNIGFTVPELSDVRMTVSDQYGNFIKVLIDKSLKPDNCTIQWICDDEPAGLYFIRLQTGNKFIVKKVVVIR